MTTERQFKKVCADIDRAQLELDRILFELRQFDFCLQAPEPQRGVIRQ